MNNPALSPNEAALNATLWETGRAILNSDADAHMPLIVVSTATCAGLNDELSAQRIEGDIRYLYALPNTAGSPHEPPPFDDAIPVTLATSRVGLMFVAIDPRGENDLSVAFLVSRAARKAGLFVVALAAQATTLTDDAQMHDAELLQVFDSVINLPGTWPEAQTLACRIIRHLAGGLKVAPPVCTDLADVRGILRGAIVSVGVGEAFGPASAGEAGRAWEAATRAIMDVGCSSVAAATGVMVVIAGNYSVRLSEISRVTHQVGNLVKSASAFVIPTVHVELDAPDRFRVLVLVARSS